MGGAAQVRGPPEVARLQVPSRAKLRKHNCAIRRGTGGKVASGSARPAKSTHMGNTAEPAILVVEDDAVFARGVARIASSYGPVRLASTLGTATAVIRQSRSWRALVLDVGLPDGSGLDVLVSARKTGITAAAALLTGHIETNVLNAAFDLGAAVLAKPVEASRLRWFLASQMGEHGPSSPETAAPDDVDGHGQGPASGANAPSVDPVDAYCAALSRFRQITVSDWYAVAMAARAVCHGGQDAVARCAMRTGLDHRTIEKEALVASRIESHEFEQLVTWQDGAGCGLSTCHVYELSRASRALRTDALQQMRSGLWSVVVLRRRLRERKRESRPPGAHRLP